MKKIWTNEEIRILREMYGRECSLREIALCLHRSERACAHKANQLGVSKKIVRKNNPNFKAIYQNYDWCYERYINRNMSHEEMAKEANCSKRVMQKWCADIHGLNHFTFRKYKKLSDIQYRLIMFGTLGDGHIDRRNNEPMYIECHSENEKDYIFWKYEILKSICNKEPRRYGESTKSFGTDRLYNCKAYYRLNTRTIDQLKEIRAMSRYDKINRLDEFGLSLHLLDDGSRADVWTVCLAEWSDAEIDLYIKICKNRFNLICTKDKDPRYAHFTALSSKKIDEIILKNIPNDIDIIRKKILDNKQIKKCRHHRSINMRNGSTIGLANFCRTKKYLYSKAVEIFDSFDKEYVDEDVFDKRYKKIA